MVGEFNCSNASDVQRFLTEDCLLNNCESKPCWFDLALSYGELASINVEYTLNFRENPRFEHNTIEINSRNAYPQDFPVLKKCSIYVKGKEPVYRVCARCVTVFSLFSVQQSLSFGFKHGNSASIQHNIWNDLHFIP